MNPKDVEKTAFTTPYSLFQFRTMPFGLANALSTFQRLMELVLAGLHWEACLIYMDNIVIFSASFDEHVARQRQVMEQLREANLQLNPVKCHLFLRKVECLVYIVSNKGIRTDPNKTKAVNDWPRPRTVKDVRSFLGLYYRRFVKNFADIAAPLYLLTQHDAVFEWSPECESAFIGLKHALVEPPILGYHAGQGLFMLDTDASDVGMGLVLSQLRDGQEHVIAYFSTLYTYDFRIEHGAGKLHSNADGLSRRPCQDCAYCTKREKADEEEDAGCPGHRVAKMELKKDVAQDTWVAPWTASSIWEWQREDADLSHENWS